MSLVDILDRSKGVSSVQFNILIEDEFLRDPTNFGLFSRLFLENRQMSRCGMEQDIRSLEVAKVGYSKSPLLYCFLGHLYSLHPSDDLNSDLKQSIENEKMMVLRSSDSEKNLEEEYAKKFLISLQTYLNYDNRSRAIDSFRKSVDKSKSNPVSFSRVIDPCVSKFLNEYNKEDFDIKDLDSNSVTSLYDALENARRRLNL